MDRGDLCGWTAQDRPVMLACTHGKKDRCCAKFGFAAYSELARRAGPDGPEVWESTHLGGCRLSGSALSFPAMRKYGRIEPGGVADLLADEAADRPWLPGWRGASHLPAAGQAAAHMAESWARARDGRMENCQEMDGHWQATIALPDGIASLHLKTVSETLIRPGTCDDLDAEVFAKADTWHAYLVRVVRDLAA
ncbi:MAG: sucrase ferredoxin [Pseudomonadota bacterium]